MQTYSYPNPGSADCHATLMWFTLDGMESVNHMAMLVFEMSMLINVRQL